MPERRVLFFDGTRLTGMRWSAAGVAREESFGSDPVGLEAFGSYLRAHRKSLFYMLADVAEEGFQLESIPYVQGGDRSALIKRRLSQYFYGSSYSVGISLGREKEGRRDEKMLFAALTRPESLTPWLDRLRETDAVLVGVYTVPLVLNEQAPAFLAARQRCLLITLSSGGLRQTYFDGGHIHFSRLSSLTTDNPAEIAAACLAEAARTYQYLLGQRLLKRGNTLPTQILAHPGQIDTIRSHCHSSADIEIDVGDHAVLAGAKKRPVRADDALADGLLAHGLVAHTPKRQFAPSAERRHYRLWQTRFALHATALAILFSGIVVAGRLGSKAYETRQEIETLHTVTGSSKQRYQNILDSLPKVQLTPEQLRTVISGFKQLQRRTTAYEDLLVPLGATLENFPGIELQRLEWSLVPDFSAKLGAGEAAPLIAAIGSRLGSSPNPPPGATRAAATWAVVNIEAQLPAKLAKDQRALVELVDRFADELRRHDVEVLLTKRPVDVESAKSLKSRIESLLGNETTPRFELRLGRAIDS